MCPQDSCHVDVPFLLTSSPGPKNTQLEQLSARDHHASASGVDHLKNCVSTNCMGNEAEL
eukprot:5881019-Alexandrium_andersonii.AAC.1